MESEVYEQAERERYLAERKGLLRKAAISQTVKDLGHHDSREDEAKTVKQTIMNEIYSDVKKPQFFNDPKIKARIKVGQHLFERKYGAD